MANGAPNSRVCIVKPSRKGRHAVFFLQAERLPRHAFSDVSQVEDILSDRSVLEKAAAFEQGSSAGQGRLSPMPVVRPVKKLAFRHRSPNSGSPRVKSRRASLGGGFGRNGDPRTRFRPPGLLLLRQRSLGFCRQRHAYVAHFTIANGQTFSCRV